MKHLFFDLDGTLADSSKGIFNCFTLTFTELGIDLPESSVVKTFIGPPLETTFAQFGDDEFVHQALSIYRQHYRDKGVNQAELYPAIKDCLEELQTAGYQLYVATSKNEPMAVKMLTELSIADYFQAVFGALETSYSKADILKRALTRYKIPVAEALMIGDTHFDITGAKSLGMRSLGVTWGFNSRQTLVDSGADEVITQPRDIIKTVESL